MAEEGTEQQDGAVPTFSLAHNVARDFNEEDDAELEELQLSSGRERDSHYEDTSSEDEHHISPFKSKATSKARRTASRATSRASNSSSAPLSRLPSIVDGEVYGFVESEVYGVEEVHEGDGDDRDEGEEKGEKGREGEGKREEEEGVVLEKVHSHASAIVEIFVNPVERESWRKVVHKTLENPFHSRLALVIAIIMNLLVLMSIIIVVAFPPRFSPDAPRDTLDKLEIFVSVVFTVEYVLRFITCSYWFRWFIKPTNFIDLSSLLPFYVQLITEESVTGLQILRFVRLLRILRLVKALKLAKHYRHLYGSKFRTKKRYLKLKYVLEDIEQTFSYLMYAVMGKLEEHLVKS